MRLTTDDVRIREIKELAPPSHLLREFPVSEKTSVVTYESRQAIHRILHGMDDRLLVVMANPARRNRSIERGPITASGRGLAPSR